MEKKNQSNYYNDEFSSIGHELFFLKATKRIHPKTELMHNEEMSRIKMAIYHKFVSTIDSMNDVIKKDI